MTLTLPFAMSKPAAVLFGAECHLTARVLAEVLARDLPIAAIVLSGPPGMDAPLRPSPPGQRIQMLTAPSQLASVAEIAASRRIDTYRIGNMRSSQTLQMLQSLGADYLLSVCFPRRIPAAARDTISGPALNLHPSLLPELRGPDPMFWTFHAGDGTGGLTLHELSDTLDGGKIASQRTFTIPDGISERDLERHLTPVAVDMLIELLPGISSRQLVLREQDNQLATYAPFPEKDDYRLHLDWPGRRGFNFVRGVADRGEPILVDLKGQRYRIESVAAHTDRPVTLDAGQTTIEMADGFLVARLSPYQD